MQHMFVGETFAANIAGVRALPRVTSQMSSEAALLVIRFQTQWACGGSFRMDHYVIS